MHPGVSLHDFRASPLVAAPCSPSPQPVLSAGLSKSNHFVAKIAHQCIFSAYWSSTKTKILRLLCVEVNTAVLTLKIVIKFFFCCFYFLKCLKTVYLDTTQRKDRHLCSVKFSHSSTKTTDIRYEILKKAGTFLKFLYVILNNFQVYLRN